MPDDARPGPVRSGLPGFLDAKRWVQLAAAVLGFGAAWSLMFATMYESESITSSSDGTEVSTTTFYRLIDVVGPAALLIAVVPLALTVVPLLAVRYRQAISVGCTAVLGILTVLTGFTIGVFGVPALLASVVACLVPERRHAPVPAMPADRPLL